jgi:hypothetical protein
VENHGAETMPTVAISRNLTKVNPNDAFQESLDILPDLGYVIWKTRPLAWLVIANRELPEGKINATVSFRPGDGAVLSASLTSETMSETALQVQADELAEAFIKRLSTPT